MIRLIPHRKCQYQGANTSAQPRQKQRGAQLSTHRGIVLNPMSKAWERKNRMHGSPFNGFSGTGWSPSASILYPKYSTEGAINKYLPLLRRRPAYSILLSTSSSAAIWPLSSGPVMSTSSMYTTTPGIFCSKFSITRWKIPGADETPNGRHE